MQRIVRLSPVVILSLLTACDPSPGAMSGGAQDSEGSASTGVVETTDASTSGGEGNDESGGGSTSGDDSGAATSGNPGPEGEGLPCEINDLLAENCRACHGGTPAGGAVNSMMTYDDLLADSLSAPGTTVGELSLQRMQADMGQMPPLPSPKVPQAQIDVWAAWVDAGMPTGDCSPGPDEPDPFDVDPVCTTGQYWNGGLFQESSRMDPGRACIDCHENPQNYGGFEGGPYFAFAGTLYATGHEPDDCNGVNGDVSGAQIVITASDGASMSLTPNSVGNFGTSMTPGPGPWTVKVVAANGMERAMAGALTDSGDCNSCHTQDGANDAPGRVIIPF